MLSVIVPTLNEAEHLPAVLADLRRQQNIALEILVSDGGSSDGTKEAAEAFGALWVEAQRGRATQMNRAAEKASGDFLFFLHADSRLEDPSLLDNALLSLQRAAQADFRVAGHFSLRFVRTNHRNDLAYRYLEEKTASNRAGTINGDQGLLLSREFFQELGGFDEGLPFLEDQRLAAKIAKQGRWLLLPGVLATSARRFEVEGFHRRYLLMGVMMGLHSIGEASFFRQAPAIYRSQHEAGRLLLSPFFRLLWGMVCREWGVRGTVSAFYRFGKLMRKNTWQFFFWVDVCMRPLLGAGRSPCLRLYDRLLAPFPDLWMLNVAAGLLCFVWYLLVLPPVFWLLDLRCRKLPAPAGSV